MRSTLAHIWISIAGVLSAVAVLTAMELPRSMVYRGVVVICIGVALQWIALIIARRE